MENPVYPFVPYHLDKFPDAEMIRKSRDFYEHMSKRRSVRDFSEEPVPLEVIRNAVMAAATAPSGAHKQPWTFCVVGKGELRRKMREAAEKEEFESYNGRMSMEWLRDLAPLGTDWRKPFIEEAPWIIVVFKRIYEMAEGGEKRNNYYVAESVGIAVGFLLAALHSAGLAALTHTPSPMNFLGNLLQRPENERAFVLIPVGFPSDKATVPDLQRKEIQEVMLSF